jgi:ribose transport system permease protein
MVRHIATRGVYKFLATPVVAILLLCVVLWGLAEGLFPGFASLGHMRYMLELAAMLGIVAGGQTVVILTAGIDLSVGAMITFAAVLGPSITLLIGDSGLMSVPLLLMTTAAIGAINGFSVSALRIHPMIMTLATATILTGVMLLASGGTAVRVSSPVVIWLANAHVAGISISIIVWLAVAVALILLLRWTVLGLWIYAVGTSQRASELSAVDERAVHVAAYAISGFLAGLTGVLLSGVTMQGSIGIGDPYLLMSVAAVVMGGTSILGGQGGYGGTIAGSILLTTLTSLITVIDISAGARNVLLGLLVLGLLGLYAREARRA